MARAVPLLSVSIARQTCPTSFGTRISEAFCMLESGPHSKLCVCKRNTSQTQNIDKQSVKHTVKLLVNSIFLSFSSFLRNCLQMRAIRRRQTQRRRLAHEHGLIKHVVVQWTPSAIIYFRRKHCVWSDAYSWKKGIRKTSLQSTRKKSLQFRAHTHPNSRRSQIRKIVAQQATT